MKSLSDHAKLSRLRDENRKLTQTVKTLTADRQAYATRATNAEKIASRWERRFDQFLGSQRVVFPCRWVCVDKPGLDVCQSVNNALHFVESQWRIDIHESGQANAVPAPQVLSCACDATVGKDTST